MANSAARADTSAPCSMCFASLECEDLIDLAGYPVCRACLEQTSREIGAPKRRLFKIRDGKQVAGICGGLADFANFDRDTFRVIFVIAAVTTGIIPLLAVYVLMSFVLPTEP